MIDDLMDIILMVLMGGFIIFALSMLLLLIFAIFTPQPNPMAKQNVVCDTSCGVQYFEHKGVLTLRVNNEGKPVKCYE